VAARNTGVDEFDVCTVEKGRGIQCSIFA
jgi:hypothetical protein